MRSPGMVDHAKVSRGRQVGRPSTNVAKLHRATWKKPEVAKILAQNSCHGAGARVSRATPAFIIDRRRLFRGRRGYDGLTSAVAAVKGRRRLQVPVERAPLRLPAPPVRLHPRPARAGMKGRGSYEMAETAVHVLNGPNLNLLGTRGAEIYGSDTLADVEGSCRAEASGLGLAILSSASRTTRASSSTGSRGGPGRRGRGHQCRRLHPHFDRAQGCHRRLRRAAVEVHISNVHARETFRHRSQFVARLRRRDLRLRSNQLPAGARGHQAGLERQGAFGSPKVIKR